MDQLEWMADAHTVTVSQIYLCWEVQLPLWDGGPGQHVGIQLESEGWELGVNFQHSDW